MAETTNVALTKRGGRISRWLERNEPRVRDYRHTMGLFFRSPLAVLGLVIVLLFVLTAALAPLIAPYGEKYWDLDKTLKPPTSEHLFGTDSMGGDVFSRMIWGSRLALAAGLVVVVSAFIIGTFVGGLSGFSGGVIAEVVMRVTDVFLAFPALILAMVVCGALGKNLVNIMLALCVTWWPVYARLVRGQFLIIKEQKYIEAARVVGGNSPHIIVRHLLPNSLSPLIVQASMDFGNVIVIAAALSYIGFGEVLGTAEWGCIVTEGATYMWGAPWILITSGLTMIVVCLGFNLLGDGIRDITDPRMRR